MTLSQFKPNYVEFRRDEPTLGPSCGESHHEFCMNHNSIVSRHQSRLQLA